MSKPRRNTSAPAPKKWGQLDILPAHDIAARYPEWSAQLTAVMGDHMQDRVNRGLPALIHNPVSWGEGDAAVCLDGNMRARLCAERGFPFSYEPFQGEEKDIPAYIAGVNDHRRHEVLSISERRKRREAVIKAHPDWSNRKLAEETGATDKTIAADRANLGAEYSAPEKRTGKNKRQQASHKKPKNNRPAAKMPTRQKILDCLRSAGKPMSVGDIISLLSMRPGIKSNRHIESILTLAREARKVDGCWTLEPAYKTILDEAKPAETPAEQRNDDEPEAAGSTAASEPAETPMKFTPKVLAWAEKLAAFLEESFSDIHGYLDFLQCCEIGIRVLTKARDQEIEQAKRDDEQDEAGGVDAHQ
jgi:hypothetical protein